jgi:hypothetical protein
MPRKVGCYDAFMGISIMMWPKINLPAWESTSETVWKWVERLSWIWIIFGIPLFFIEHHRQVERDKAAATLEFVKRYQDNQLVTQRFALLSPWMKYNLQAFMMAKPSPLAVEDMVLKMVDASAESNSNQRDMREAIFSIVDFYETLQLCIDAGSCDRALAVSYFGQYAHQFFCLYKPYILKLRSQQRMLDYGNRLERLALEGGSCDAG